MRAGYLAGGGECASIVWVPEQDERPVWKKLVGVGRQRLGDFWGRVHGFHCGRCGHFLILGASPAEAGFALLEMATRLEAQGKAIEALQTYERVVDEFPGTVASHDAAKSMESLRAQRGEPNRATGGAGFQP
jgi:hypothetical protein